MGRLRPVVTLALLLAACSRTETRPPSSSPPPTPSTSATPASVAVDPIDWELTAPTTTLPMADRGGFELWIVARNASTRPADTRRDGLEYTVNGHPSLMLSMAFGNGLREARWTALPPGETIREARGGPTEPGIGQGLFPAPGDYDLALRQDRRVVATFQVRVVR